MSGRLRERLKNGTSRNINLSDIAGNTHQTSTTGETKQRFKTSLDYVCTHHKTTDFTQLLMRTENEIMKRIQHVKVIN